MIGGGDFAPSGTLADVTIDTAGYNSGVWAMTLAGPIAGDPAIVDGGGSPITGFIIIPGSITVIPEPATLVLLGLGAALPLLRKRR